MVTWYFLRYTNENNLQPPSPATHTLKELQWKYLADFEDGLITHRICKVNLQIYLLQNFV